MKKEFLGFYFNKLGEAYNKRGLKLKYAFIGNSQTILVKKKRYKVPKILADLFIPNPKNYRHIGYKDGNHRNLKISNLEWVLMPIKKERKSTQGLNNSRSSMTREKILLIRKLLEEGELTQKEISEEVGCTQSRVTYIKQGISYGDIK